MPFYKPRNTVEHGNRGESLVCEKLANQGYRIVARNVRYKFAELDIIAMDGETLVFIEVRTRTDTSLGHPAETITHAKQQNIYRAASMYTAQNNIVEHAMRFDVVTIVWSSMTVEHFKNAF